MISAKVIVCGSVLIMFGIILANTISYAMNGNVKDWLDSEEDNMNE